MSRLEMFLQNDRQWLRVHRIAHAKRKMKMAKAAKDTAEVEFWQAVIDANGTMI